jgi:tetratricopeptide (TPR) repeat protein
MSANHLVSRLLGCAVFCLLLASCRAEQTWTEVRSPHFRVLTDGSEKDGRRVANQFEQMRFVFAQRFKDDRLESGAPLTIVAARDANTFKALDPGTWKASKGNISGQFLHHWERQFAIIRLDTWGDENQVVVYHEYTHSVLHARFHWLPLWLDEGYAEFYGYTRFQSDHTLIGAASQRYGLLQRYTLLKVKAMLDMTSYPKDQDRLDLFYAEAWAMVHYMIFGPGMNGGEKLNAFFKLVQEQVPQEKAFEQVFGDMKTFDKNFSNYINTNALKVGVLDPDKGMDAKSFAARRLEPFEGAYEEGCFQIGAGDYPDGLANIERSITLNAAFGPAHEELGFLNFQRGKDTEAAEEWKRALALDPTLYRSLFALTMSGTPLAEQTPDQLRATLKTLRHITELAPKFAPAYAELALVEWRTGSLQLAYNDARQAETLEPWRAGYHILTGHILLRGHQPQKAAEYARYVAGHWNGPDHNEAVDLWRAVPTESQGKEPPLTLDVPPNTQTAAGRALDISCGAAPEYGLSVTFLPDPPAAPTPVTFKTKENIMIGFSDTFWWGEDHYTICHHHANSRVVVAYQPDGMKLLDLELRDDLPVDTQTPKAAEASAAPAARP